MSSGDLEAARRADYDRARRTRSEPTSRRTADEAARLYDLLRTVVSDSDLAERELSEYRVVAETGASRATVREALQALSHDGLVTRRRRLGTHAIDLVTIPVDEYPVIEEYDDAEPDRLGHVTRGASVRSVSEMMSGLTGLPAGSPVLGLDALLWWRSGPVGTVSTYMRMDDPGDLDRLGHLFFLGALDEAGHSMGVTESLLGHMPADDRTAELLEVERGAPLLWLRDVVRSTEDEFLSLNYYRFRADRAVISSRTYGGPGSGR